VLDVGGGDDCKDTSAVAGAGKSIKAICRELNVSRKVVRKVLRSDATEFRYERKQQPFPRMGVFRRASLTLLEGDRRPNLTPVFVLMDCPFLRNGRAGDEVVDTIARIRREFHIQGWRSRRSPRAARLAEHGAQGAALGRRRSRMSGTSAAAEDRPWRSSWTASDGEQQSRPRAADADPHL
jgi:hypothetical protein